jgi:hypothetical protein
MTLQTDHRPDTDISVGRSSIRQSHRILWLLAVFLAVAIAGVAGVAVAAHLTRPAATNPIIYQAPNANTREGRVPSTPVQAPNANTREGRVPSTPVQAPNANTREGRVPANT